MGRAAISAAIPIRQRLLHHREIADTSKSSKMRKKKCSIQFHQDSPSHSSVISPLDILSEDNNGKCGSPPKELQGVFSKLNPCQNETCYFGPSEYSFQNLIHDSRDVFDSTHDQIGHGNSYPYQWTTDVDPMLLEDNFFSDQTIKVKEKYDMSPLWKKSPARNLKKESTQIETSVPYDTINNAQDAQYSFDCPSGLSKLGIKSCSFMENEQDSAAYYPNHSGFGFEFDRLGKDFSLHDTMNATDDSYCSENLNCRDTTFQKNIDASRPSFSFLRRCQTTRELDVLSTNSIDPFFHDRASLTEENNLHKGLVAHVWETGSKCESPVTGWFLGSPYSLLERSPKMGHDLTNCYTSKGNLRSSNSVGCRHSGTKEENVELFNPFQKCYNEVLPANRVPREEMCTTISLQMISPL